MHFFLPETLIKLLSSFPILPVSLRFFLRIIMCPENKDPFLVFFLCLCACVLVYIDCAHMCAGTCVYSEVPGFLRLPQLFLPIIQWGRVSKSKPELTDMARLTSCLALGILSPLPSLGLQASSCACPHLHPYLHELCELEPQSVALTV